MGYMGKGRNLKAQKRYDEAIPLFSHVIKLYDDYSSGYSFRADSYYELKQYDKAIEDVIMAISIDNDLKAVFLMLDLFDSAFNETLTKFKVQKIKDPNDDYWDYCIGKIYAQQGLYPKAIEHYKSSFKLDASDITAKYIATCYEEMGDYGHALEYWDIAIQLDSSDVYYWLSKSITLADMGDTTAALKLMNELLEKHPDYDFAYLRRGMIKETIGDPDGALEDYNLAISFDSDYAYTYFKRARLYDVMGEMDKATADYRKSIELDDMEEEAQVAYFCYYYLGDKEKAIEMLHETLKNGSKGNYYNAACLYAIMGETDSALYYLKIAFEKGYCKFSHIERDEDLNNIRHEEAFQQLVAEYKDKMQQKSVAMEQEDEADYEEKMVEIPFTKEGGVCKVKCTINGLPLHFIFDTGASDVSISSVEAAFMLKNEYLQSSDLGNSQYYLTANGDISEGTSVILRNISFGGLSLENVKASVVKAQSAPLLLGQSVLGRLGKIEIDNEKRVLRITHKEKKKEKQN